VEINSINAAEFARLFLSGAANLEAKKEWINELNVFPVPDGDTGTNMCMTIMAAAKEVKALDDPDMKSLAKAVSSGSLRGARGNSGVILSQLFRGFTKVIAEYDTVTVGVLARAMEKAVETAYKAVMKPKEGTILTVAKGAAIKALELAESTTDLLVFAEAVVKEADRVLLKTPDMLPVLKQAGVVDSGGQGLVEVLRGALFAMQGKEMDYEVSEESKPSAFVQASSHIDAQANQEIRFTYCTQFLVMLEHPYDGKKEAELKAYLEEIGDSIVVVADDEVVKVHVHTNDPGLAMQKGLCYGSLTEIIIENMKLERDEKISALKEKEMQNITPGALTVKEGVQAEIAPEPESVKEMGFVTVSIGEGLNEIFYGLGADYIIEGGQTMNPSTDDVLQAVSKVNAKTVFILPNNKNIILAANQAASLCEDKKLVVIPTRTIPQGITALVNYIPGQSPEANESHMNEEISYVKTGQVTYAIRDTEIDDKEIHQGDYMGIGDKSILSVGADRKSVTLEMVDQMIDEDSSLVSIYYGKDATAEEAAELSAQITKGHPYVEVEVNEGGQPIYYYVVSVE
jgi:DAK2 domain fusion protein YloV